MNLTQQLIGLLGQTAAFYEKVAQASLREQKSMKAMDFAGLSDATSEKETLVLQLKMLEGSRQALVEKIAARAGLDPRKAGLRDIAASAEAGNAGAVLLAAGERLKKAAERASGESDFSRRLIGRALDTVAESIRCANTLLGGPSATYANGGILEGKVRSGMMVERSF